MRVELTDGPRAGAVVEAMPGTCIVVPEYQRCDTPLCHAHVITHEYNLDGTWRRSYSFLAAYLDG